MKIKKEILATIGLIFITVLAAVQYIFLRNVPETVPTFSFICITNVIGLVLIGLIRIKKLFTIKPKTLLKGILFAAELTGFNFFLLLGSQHLDPVITSSVVSMYFVFITPMLLLLRRKVNFFSGIATVIAVIALLLMFGADTDMLFSSKEVIYLIIADLFFAAYVVSVAILGEKEDSTQLTLSQMIFAALFAFIGWHIECAITGLKFYIPVEKEFWISAIFIGVCIRAIYGIIQISAQKHVSALKASLIFSAEIIITLITNPLMCKLFNTEYTPITVFQIAGALLLIIATLMVDETITKKVGYEDLLDRGKDGSKGITVRKTSVSKKMILTTLTFTMITLILSTVTFLSAIYLIRNEAVSNSKSLGENASSVSSEAMMGKLEESIQAQATDKALLAEQKLNAYSDSAMYASSYASSLYADPENYPEREVPLPEAENAGIWAMQRTLAAPSVKYEDILDDSKLLGNMIDAFAPIIENNDNIATIYLGTESGLLVSYDPYSDSAVDMPYYEYRDSGWFRQGRNAEGTFFTEPYQDGYGRGLTISCVAPFYYPDGRFAGCIGIDILMDELNASMVNDGIVDPSVATLIDSEGNYIAGKGVDPLAEDMGNIFHEGKDTSVGKVARQILEKKNGITSVGEGENADYIAFATIESTDWTLCILTPVYSVIQPAVTIRQSIDESTSNVVSTVSQGIMNIIQSCLLLSALILLFVTLFTGRFSRKISDPLKKLEADVKNISGGNLDSRTEVTTDDEIGTLAETFNNMTDSLQKYIADLKEVTAKEERIAGELSAATAIQAGMMPKNFGDYAPRNEFELFATMKPAKEVGGDFYDFFKTDDDHIALVMADVSGKGIPAALFMVRTKTMIRNHAQLGESPAEVLYNANNQLMEGNDAEMFVTVWLGIIDIRTGKGIAANAGHEHPVIKRADGLYELIKYRHSPAVATMEGIRFKEHEFEMYPGDSLFVYTDGVPEATDKDGILFGSERMLESMNRNTEATPEELLENLHSDVDAFVGEAPQFDDITMLNFRFYGRKEDTGETAGEEASQNG